MGRSDRGTEASGKDRRSVVGQRVHFEAMVAIGGASGGAGFEAESVDVSSHGMRLRTAYLPAIGDQLVCRFDGADGEIVALGEVVWANEEGRGGEFALRFVDVDADTEAALRALCGKDEDDAAPAEEASKKPAVAAGTRVRLHIEGLASPMKARVKDGDDRGLAVGSSLEFLKLGRPVEIEDVDRGARREGFVDHVKVEVDPSTSVPQLVVSLRFDALQLLASPSKDEASSSVTDAREEASSKAPSTNAAATNKPAKSRADGKSKGVVDAKSGETASSEGKAARAAASDADSADEGSSASDDIDEENPFGPSKLAIASQRAKELGARAASSIVPALGKVGAGATSLWSTMRQTVEGRISARNGEATSEKSSRRRVTAPPPGGALTSEGRRVVRHEAGDEAPETVGSLPMHRPKRGVVLGAAAALVVLLGVVGLVRRSSSSEASAEGLAAAPSASTSAAAHAIDASMAALPPIPGAPATADVPLYGPTPLSTTEQLPTTPPASGDPSASLADGGDAAEGMERGEKGEGEEKPAKLAREFGKAGLKSKKPLKLRMDGPVDGIVGTDTDDGFTLTIPGRKALSTTTALVKKDDRLSAVDVINKEDGVEIAVRFKGDKPDYFAKVQGDRLEIALDAAAASSADEAEGEEKVAKVEKPSKASKASKKTASKSKAKSKKKPSKK